jgi:hypothetical protein
MSTIARRFIAVGKFPTSAVGLLKFTQALMVALTNNGNFVDAAQVIAALNAAFGLLDGTETAAQTRTKGTVAARNAAKANLLTTLHGAKAYVQQKADANVEQGQAIIESAGLTVRKASASTKPEFAAKQGAVSGSVHLTARATARRCSYEWQWSADGGKTWTVLPTTLQARTTVQNLPVGVMCAFRFRPVTKAGEGDFSQVVTLLVK